MDYQIHIYPSSDAEMQNVRAENGTKQIKVLQEGRLQSLYKKSFGAAVTKYNERVTSGKLIDNYYKSIVKSNVPEVYRMSLLIRYDTANKTEAAAVNKAFHDFKKALEKENYIVIASAYIMSFGEYKEMQIFFYPVASDYATGLSVRNDLIDVTKKLCDVKENINILQAAPLFVKHLDKLFEPINNAQFLSQDQLEELVRQENAEDPLDLHAIAIETLKEQMRNLQRINAENKQLETLIEGEKQRIEHDIVWSKETEQAIYKAEEARLAEIRRIEEEARKAEEIRRALEAQKREEERLREEARRVEAERLADQARRNIELRKQLEREEEERRQLLEQQIESNDFDQARFDDLLAKHKEWQDFYLVDSSTELDDLPEDALIDERRINLNGAEIENVHIDGDVSLICAVFHNCKFTNCKIAAEFVTSAISECSFVDSDLSNIILRRCRVSDLNLDRLTINNAQVYDSPWSYVSAKNAVFNNLFSYPRMRYAKCDFTDATFKDCDMKNNRFVRCDFTNAKLDSCDLRSSVFRVSQIDSMRQENSSFRSVKIEKK